MTTTAEMDIRRAGLDPVVVALREERVRQGLTQNDVADRAGVTRLTVGRMERGDRSPELWTLRRIADALGVDLLVVAREGL